MQGNFQWCGDLEQFDSVAVQTSCPFLLHCMDEGLIFMEGNRLAAICFPKASHTFSMRSRSGKRAGQPTRWISSVSRQSCTDCMRWQDALSSIKRNFLRVMARKIRICGSRPSSMYRLHSWNLGQRQRHSWSHWTWCLLIPWYFKLHIDLFLKYFFDNKH